MRVYFTASLRGKKEFAGNYNKIFEIIRKLGHTVVSDHILKNSFEEVAAQDKTQAQNSYQKLINSIKKADLFIAEVSTQSLSVGHEITEALNLNKPVVVLYVGDRRPSMLFGSGYEKLKIVQYDMNGDLEELLKNAIEEAMKYADVRFNFFVSPKILAYLDLIAQKRMIPRSVFLRNLIEREMKRDKGFQG